MKYILAVVLDSKEEAENILLNCKNGQPYICQKRTTEEIINSPKSIGENIGYAFRLFYERKIKNENDQRKHFETNKIL